jgi:hypothetical protein
VLQERQSTFPAMDTEPNPYNPPDNPPSPSPAAPTSWRLYLELLALTGFVFPFGQILGPMVLWLIKKDTVPEVDAEGKRVMNFNISWTIWGILSCGIMFFVWMIILLISILKSANREPFRHPLTIDFLK